MLFCILEKCDFATKARLCSRRLNTFPDYKMVVDNMNKSNANVNMNQRE